jgi:EAL domain-containing protein (putative c-di-GMP-specific phosphodiesterase class I)
VETAGQFAFLEGEGCDEVQGYYFSRPVSASDLDQLLAAPTSPQSIELQQPAPAV